MPTNSTGAGSQDKYERWFPLLEKELGLVAKSDAKIISIGKRWADSSPARGFTAMSERFLTIRGGPPGAGGMKLSARIGRENSWYSPEGSTRFRGILASLTTTAGQTPTRPKSRCQIPTKS